MTEATDMEEISIRLDMLHSLWNPFQDVQLLIVTEVEEKLQRELEDVFSESGRSSGTYISKINSKVERDEESGTGIY